MFSRRIGGREDRELQLRLLGVPPRLTGRGAAAVRRTPEERRVLYLSYTMDRADAVTIPAVVLDRVERSLKTAYKELKEAHIIAHSRAETTVSPAVSAQRSPAVSPFKAAAVPPPVQTCRHCNMHPTSEPSHAVLGGVGLKRQFTIVNGEAAEPARRVSPSQVTKSPSNQQRAESEQPPADSKAKKCLVPCFAGACVSRSCVCLCSCVLILCRYCQGISPHSFSVDIPPFSVDIPPFLQRPSPIRSCFIGPRPWMESRELFVRAMWQTLGNKTVNTSLKTTQNESF